MQVGQNFRVGDDLWLEAVVAYGAQRFSPALTIGDNVNVSDRVHIACIDRVSIGAGTLIGSRVIITDHAHGVYRDSEAGLQSDPETLPVERLLDSPGPVTIGRNVWIGDGVAVLPGSDIGDGAVIGANSVVRGVIPAATIAVGAPAKPVRRWDEASEKWVSLT
jgi:lipopolysaccharide O-acetyltransferase